MASLFGTPLHAQPHSPSKASTDQISPSATPGSIGYWQTMAGRQQAQLLRSRHEAVRTQAMQNIIRLANEQPGEIDLTPTVPALLNIYAAARDDQHQIMAVAALHAVGSETGFSELYRLSQDLGHSERARLIAQTAVQQFNLKQSMDHETERAAYHLARGHTKRAERHLRKAAFYQNQIIN